MKINNIPDHHSFHFFSILTFHFFYLIESNRYLETLTDLKQENENLKNSKPQTVPTNFEKFISTYKEEISDLKESLNTTQKKLEEANQKLNSSKGNMMSEDSDKNDLIFENNQLKNTVDLLNNEVKQLQLINEQNEENKKKWKENDQLDSQNEHLKETIESVRRDLNNSKSMRELLEQQINLKGEENRKAHIELDKQKKLAEQFSQENGQLLQQIEKLKLSLEESQNVTGTENKNLKELINKINFEKKTVEEQKQKLEGELFNKNIELQRLKKDAPPSSNDSPKHHDTESQILLESLQQQVSLLKETIQQFQQEKIKLENEINTLSEREKQSNNEISTLEKNNEILLEKLNKMENSTSFQEDNSVTFENTQKLLLLEKTNNSLSERVEHLQREKENIELINNQKITQLEKENYLLRETKMQLSNQIKDFSLNNANNTFENNNEDLRHAYSEIERLKKVNSSLQIVEQQNEALRREKMRLENSKTQLMEQFKDLRKTHEETVNDLETVCSEIVDLYHQNKNFKQLKVHNDVLSSQVEKLSSQNKSLILKLERKDFSNSNINDSQNSERLGSINKMQKHISFIKNLLGDDDFSLKDRQNHSLFQPKKNSKKKNFHKSNRTLNSSIFLQQEREIEDHEHSQNNKKKKTVTFKNNPFTSSKFLDPKNSSQIIDNQTPLFNKKNPLNTKDSSTSEEYEDEASSDNIFEEESNTVHSNKIVEEKEQILPSSSSLQENTNQPSPVNHNTKLPVLPDSPPSQREHQNNTFSFPGSNHFENSLAPTFNKTFHVNPENDPNRSRMLNQLASDQKALNILSKKLKEVDWDK